MSTMNSMPPTTIPAFRRSRFRQRIAIASAVRCLFERLMRPALFLRQNGGVTSAGLGARHPFARGGMLASLLPFPVVGLIEDLLLPPECVRSLLILPTYSDKQV